MTGTAGDGQPATLSKGQRRLADILRRIPPVREQLLSQRSAARLREAMDLRNELGHAYPPAAWHGLHEGVVVLLDELDRYIARFAEWAAGEGILPPM